MARRPDGGCGFKTVHDGHLDVHEHERVASGLGGGDLLEGFGAVACRFHVDAEVGEQIDDDLAVHLVVLRQQDARAAVVRSRGFRIAVVCGAAWLVERLQRYLHHEGSACVLCAFDVHGTAHQAHQVVHDGKPQSAADLGGGEG